MSVATGVEDLKIIGASDERTALAAGTLVRIIHTYSITEKGSSTVPGLHQKADESEPSTREVERVLHGEVKSYRYDNAIQMLPTSKGERTTIVRTPTIAYHIGEVILESHDGEPRFEHYNDIILHDSDPKYDITAVPPVIR